MKHKDFIEHAFQRLYERKWLKELIPSNITEAEITAFEHAYQIKFPALFKAYLTTYKLSSMPHSIVGLVENSKDKEIKIKMINWHDLTDDSSDLEEDLECFREEFADWETPLAIEKYKNLFPIGYMDGWYCLDLTQSDGEDCPVVFLEYGGFWEGYYDADGVLHGEQITPNFRTLLEWYFWGTLEEEYEKRNHVTVNYEFYIAWIQQNFICY
jgi:hypothetical protein